MGLLVQDRLQSASLILGVATLTGALTAGRTLLSMVAAPLAGTISDWLGSRWRVAAWGLTIGIIGMALVACGGVARHSGRRIVGRCGQRECAGPRHGPHGRPGQRHRAAGRLRFDAVDWAARGVSALCRAVRSSRGAGDAVSAGPRRHSLSCRHYVIRCQALPKVPGT